MLYNSLSQYKSEEIGIAQGYQSLSRLILYCIYWAILLCQGGQDYRHFSVYCKKRKFWYSPSLPAI